MRHNMLSTRLFLELLVLHVLGYVRKLPLQSKLILVFCIMDWKRLLEDDNPSQDSVPNADASFWEKKACGCVSGGPLERRTFFGELPRDLLR